MSLVPDTVTEPDDEGGPFGGLLGMFGGLGGLLDGLPDPAAMAEHAERAHREQLDKLDEIAANLLAVAAAVETLCQLLGPLGRLVEHPGIAALLDGKSIGAAMVKGGASQ